MQAITPLHVERGRQMRRIVQQDVVERGLSLDTAFESLAAYLGITVGAVKLAVAIANDADQPEGERVGTYAR